jgi:hypothetical protein
MALRVIRRDDVIARDDITTHDVKLENDGTKFHGIWYGSYGIGGH